MLVFATSDKGGTGRSVTSSNVAYRRALQGGGDVCYVDFDFGSPTVGAVFGVPAIARGVAESGLHSYFLGGTAEPARVDLWREAEHISGRDRPPWASRLVLLPGDRGGSEFPSDPGKVRLCVELFARLEDEFDITLVDLSAGRSYAVRMALAATADPAMRHRTARWLVFHRWTSQHVIAAAGLIHEENGILDIGVDCGHERDALLDSIRLVRTAVQNPEGADLAGLTAAQLSWLRQCNQDLQELAHRRAVGRTTVIAEIPLDPVLQWREQLISDTDVDLLRIANEPTAQAFTALAERLDDAPSWEPL